MEYARIRNGGVGERLKPAVLKTARLERVSGVRIPPPPPTRSSTARKQRIGPLAVQELPQRQLSTSGAVTTIQICSCQDPKIAASSDSDTRSSMQPTHNPEHGRPPDERIARPFSGVVLNDDFRTEISRTPVDTLSKPRKWSPIWTQA